MADMRADLAAWLSMDLLRTLEVAKEISHAQSNCASSFTTTETCLLNAQRALDKLDEARNELAQTIKRTEQHAQS